MRVGDVYQTKVYDNHGMTLVMYVLIALDSCTARLLSCHSGNVFDEDLRWMTLEDMGYAKIFSCQSSEMVLL